MFGSTRRAVRAKLQSSSLPPELNAFIERIVRATRLRTSEQIDITRELVSHFAEGLSAGAVAQALITDYGDPKQSARALRTSAIRKRNIVDRITRSTSRYALAGFGLASLLYFGVAWWLSSAQPVISFDGIAALNARRPHAGSEGSAWPIYLDAMRNEDGVMFIAADATLDVPTDAIGIDPLHDTRIRDWIKNNASRLEKLRELREHPVLDLSLETEETMDPTRARFFEIPLPDLSEAPESGAALQRSAFSILLPEIRMTRFATRALCLDATIAAQNGDLSRAVVDLEAAHNAALHAQEAGVAISAMVGRMARTIIARTAVSIIENYSDRLSETELERLDAIFRQRMDATRYCFEGERISLHDMLQRVFTDNGEQDGVLLAANLAPLSAIATLGPNGPSDAGMTGAIGFVAAPAQAMMHASRRDTLDLVNSLFDDMLLAAASPSVSDQLGRMAAWDQRVSALDGAKFPFVKLIMPALSNCLGSERGAVSAEELARAAIGIERFARSHGRFPDDIAELRRSVGRDLGISSEQYAHWRYAIHEGRPVIYDCGVDGSDDGGRIPLGRWEEPGLQGSMGEEISVPTVLDLRRAEVFRDDAVRALLRQREAESVRRDIAPATALTQADELAAAPALPEAIRGDTVHVLWKSGSLGSSRLLRAER